MTCWCGVMHATPEVCLEAPHIACWADQMNLMIYILKPPNTSAQFNLSVNFHCVCVCDEINEKRSLFHHVRVHDEYVLYFASIILSCMHT